MRSVRGALTAETHGFLSLQHLTELAAQRRACPAPYNDATMPQGTIRDETNGSQSFDCIADAIKLNDRPLVHIEDDENGGAVRRPPTRASPRLTPPIRAGRPTAQPAARVRSV